MSHWLLDGIADLRTSCVRHANAGMVHHHLGGDVAPVDEVQRHRCITALELAVIDIARTWPPTAVEQERTLRAAATDAFRILRALPLPADGLRAGQQVLRAASLAVIGDRGADAARWLASDGWPQLDLDSPDWRVRTWSTVIDVWLRLIRKQGWTDRDAVLERIAALRAAQAIFEREHLTRQPLAQSKAVALELIGLYHLAKTAEILALYITDGRVDGKFQIHQLLDTHLDRVIAACTDGQMLELEPIARLVAIGAHQLANNCIWTVTRAVNSRVTRFVKSLVDRGRGDRAIFDVLPPQRRSLAEEGLLGSSRRAVVVSLPTSSGKTLIAEFRALQALNQFDHERGWVAYLAPTRTLVNQIARRLRRDLEPIGVAIEVISPALEVDNIEADLLTEQHAENAFRILVTTPEKLDLMLRQGWEAKIGRPLTLVIVDEAHNIQNETRGLKLELLLATINSECERAQFLLLTPFISNAGDVARWLGGQNASDISMAVDWQPNDRVVGIVHLEKDAPLSPQSFDYRLAFEPVHTTHHTLVGDHHITWPKHHGIAGTFSKARNAARVAAIAAQALQVRGPVIVMHMRPDFVWSLAALLKHEANRQPSTPRKQLVQDFLRLEYGDAFALIELIDHGIGVHHAGLSDEVRSLMEWLFEHEELRFLVATTTIAQGVNFPVSGVVMASHQYPGDHRTIDMSPEDFWNIAGRAGRIGQGDLGVIALAAETPEKANKLRAFIHRQSGILNSALVKLACAAENELGDLESIVYRRPEWSTFVQYLAHTYRQMGAPATFVNDVEQILRNTYGFGTLRSERPDLAARLLVGVNAYTAYLQRPNQPLKLVDSTGFSLQSINTAFTQAREFGVDSTSWNRNALFAPTDRSLQSMMGVLLKVPELRDNLNAVLGGRTPDGAKLALIVKDWVHGASIEHIARTHFLDRCGTMQAAMTECGRNLSGRLTQTAAWGLGALLSITGGDLDDNALAALRNLPSCIYYGVNNDEAVALRLLGVPRMAAIQMTAGPAGARGSTADLRRRLRSMDDAAWSQACKSAHGITYRRVWRILEGMD
jgi:hypothetical protein